MVRMVRRRVRDDAGCVSATDTPEATDTVGMRRRLAAWASRIRCFA
jgi:hypothetical protein